MVSVMTTRLSKAAVALSQLLAAGLGSPRAQEVVVPRPGKLDYAALATRIDPGPQQPLSELFPPWLAERVAKEAKPDDARLAADLVRESMHPPAMLGALVYGVTPASLNDQIAGGSVGT